MQDHLSRWQHELLYQRRLSPHTANAYRRDVSRLFELCELDTPAEVTATHIRHSLALLHQQGEQPRSLARRLSAWRQFFDWALSDHSQPNPCQGVRAPKTPQPLPRALSVEQTQRLLDSLAPTQAPGAEPSLKEIIAYRDQALFELFYSCGLRLGELVSLDYRYVQTSDYQSGSWLELGEQQIHVQGKGQRQRLVPLGRQAQQALEHWLTVRPLLLPKHLRQPNQHEPAQHEPAQHEPTQTAALFLGQRGKRIHPRVVQQQLARRAQQAGLPEHVHPHRLRHSFASHILQSSQDLRAVQELLGHQNIRSTQIYTRLDFQHLAQIYDRAHPRAKKAHAENGQLEKEYTEKVHTKEDRTEVGRSETDVAKAGHVEGGRLESNDAEAGHIEVGRSEANSTEAGRTEVGHTEQNKK